MGIREGVFFGEEGSWWEKVGWNGIGDKNVDKWINLEGEFLDKLGDFLGRCMEF